MPIWTLIVWLVIGAVAGYLASRIMGTPGPYGLVGDIVLGIVGGIVGGWILGLLGVSGDGGIIGSLITAVIGAMILLWLIRTLMPGKKM
ncbi:MAG: GlsB/YeaQ/YmgE family stress response membrane protein [Chloroflexi bacterium]|nr:GlsB/YeaQ/YmgE family stress response membrane protein [Chloroflexota bacterium]